MIMERVVDPSLGPQAFFHTVNGLATSQAVLGVTMSLITLGIFVATESAALKVVRFVLFDEPLV